VSNHGKICYVELPAADIDQSAEFYSKTFGWQMRKRGDGATAFDDSTGQVSGAFAAGRTPQEAAGILFYIMVDDANAMSETIRANGGIVVQPVGGDAPEVTLRFRDPAGNLIGVYQERQSS
jgi:predicted enzyme related to lactoylglutathione lyase